jgi:hypothetical protein
MCAPGARCRAQRTGLGVLPGGRDWRRSGSDGPVCRGDWQWQQTPSGGCGPDNGEQRRPAGARDSGNHGGQYSGGLATQRAARGTESQAELSPGARLTGSDRRRAQNHARGQDVSAEPTSESSQRPPNRRGAVREKRHRREAAGGPYPQAEGNRAVRGAEAVRDEAGGGGDARLDPAPPTQTARRQAALLRRDRSAAQREWHLLKPPSWLRHPKTEKAGMSLH